MNSYKFLISSKIYAYSGAYITGCVVRSQPYVGFVNLAVELPKSVVDKFPRDIIDKTLLRHLEKYTESEFKDRIDGILSYYKLDNIYFDEGTCECINEIDESEIIDNIRFIDVHTNLRDRG
jgi:hypothetical protein